MLVFVFSDSPVPLGDIAIVDTILEIEECLWGLVHGIVLYHYERDIIILLVLVPHPGREIDRDLAEHILRRLVLEAYDRLDDTIDREEESILFRAISRLTDTIRVEDDEISRVKRYTLFLEDFR